MRQVYQSTESAEAGGSPAAGYLSCAAKKGNRKKAAPGCRAPQFAGWPCAAWLDEATAQLDLARRTHRASLRDSISARRHPLIESSCSARHKGETAFRKHQSAVGRSPPGDWWNPDRIVEMPIKRAHRPSLSSKCGRHEPNNPYQFG